MSYHYEIHITVRLSEEHIDYFKTVCNKIGVKPIVIDLQDKSGSTVIRDVMTSSKVSGDNDDIAFLEVRRIVDKLEQHKFTVIREKIETCPWHHTAPQMDEVMPSGCYWESHIPVEVTPSTLPLLYLVAPGHNFHISRNAFKKLDDDRSIIMATLRGYKEGYPTFSQHVKSAIGDICSIGLSVQKHIIEFVISDTKSEHDQLWLDS